MSAFLTRDRARRWTVQLTIGLSVGFAFGIAAHEARAEDTAASLFANPKRLEAVQQGCRTNQPWATDALCRQAAEAIRRRFRGAGVPYRPRRVDPFPTHPQLQPAPGAPPSPAMPAAKPQARREPANAVASKVI